MAYFVKFLAVCALLALAIADFRQGIDEPVFNNYLDDTMYRIPEDLDPIHCEVEITPYFEATDENEAWTFDGIVTHRVRATRDNISSIYIHENVRSLISVNLTNENGAPIKLSRRVPYERQENYHFLRINLDKGLTLVKEGQYSLRIEYIGNINETPLSGGVFRANYHGDDGKIHWYAATHLQPTYSRQAFPCFDEPGFKSTFDIIVNRPSHFTETFSNMRIKETIPMGNRVKEIFHTTPRMSAYLVTVHISEEFTVIADNNNPQRSYRILARPNAAGQGEYALQVGPPLTAWYYSYFNIDYYTMAPGMKNDHIASPSWEAAATENWGLVTYRERRLLYEEGETNAHDKMQIATITAHELAHKWFGNLITTKWWDNVWINEGFASYFEYFAMDGIDPEMGYPELFNIMCLHNTLTADSRPYTRALQHTVNSPTQVIGQFDDISYSKGASFLLMLKHFVTEQTFKKALNIFLFERSYQYASPNDLYKAFDAAVKEDGSLNSTFDIEAFMDFWVNEPGYPLLNVSVNMDTGIMTLRQERFFSMAWPLQFEQVWPLPLTYTTGRNPNWDALRPTHVMTAQNDEIRKEPGHEWVIFNVQQKGIYRVNYDTHNWEMIAEALKKNFSSIHHLNRAQIVSDVFALMESSRLPYKLGFKVLDFLKRDTSLYSWYPAVNGFTWLRNKFWHIPKVLAEYDGLIYGYLDAVIDDLGFEVIEEEHRTRTLNRIFVLSFACNIGYTKCRKDAIQKFAASQTSGMRVNPNLRQHVFCEGIRNGGHEAWRWIYDRFRLSNNQADEMVMLNALRCTSDERAGREYLEMILSDEVKAQDKANSFNYFCMVGTTNANIALQFLKGKFEELRKAVLLLEKFKGIIFNIAAHLDEDGLNDMEHWLIENQATFSNFQVGLNAISLIRDHINLGKDIAPLVLEALKEQQKQDQASAVVILPTTMVVFTTLVALLLN